MNLPVPKFQHVRFPSVKLLLLCQSLQNQGLMISKVAKHEACHVVVSLTVLLGEDQHVATHGDAVYQKNV